MIKRLRDISISYKIYIPLVLILVFGLSIMSANSYLSLQDIEKNAKEDIKKELTSYVSQKLNRKHEIALTNVIAISLHEKIATALKNHNREMAYKVLHELALQFKNYNNTNLKIHIHDKNKKSFVRSWSYEAHGDDLSLYRKSVAKVALIKKPFVVTEVGRVGMAIRAIAPVMEGENYLGSVEVIQSFDTFVTKAKEKKNYLIAVLSCEDEHPAIKSFETKHLFRDSKMRLSQDLSVTDMQYYKTLQEKFNRDEMIQTV